MKNICLVYLALAILLSWGIAGANTDPAALSSIPVPLDQGGPDAYGYRWIDNDSAGGPAFNWIDISAYGTRVVGLSDDNNVGPFSLGIDFPYYWYTVNRCWIGSNGYISFSSNANFAHPFANIPTAGLPNDLVAVLSGDLDFSRGNPSCYYYTNGVDSFIVSWLNVGEYGYIDSLHNFQLILSAADTSLLFQYGPNHGNFRDSNNENRDVIGMENVNGQVGLQYLRDNAPGNHMWHDGLAIRYYPIPDPNFVVHDFGVVDGFQDGSGAVYVQNNTAFIMRTMLKNFGNQPESNLRVRCITKRGTTTVYTDTIDVAPLAPSEEIWINFPNQFTPNQVATYSVAFSTLMTSDQNSNNNSRTCELDAYVLPQNIRYDDDIAETGRSWTGDFSGFGVEFQVPEGIRVDSAGVNIFAAGTPGDMYVWFLPDDGTGNPDESNILAGDTVFVTAAGWVTLDFTWAGLTFIPNVKFWLVGLHALQNTFSFSMDQSPPLSNRGWEYTGGLTPDRDRGLSDVMMKVYAVARPPGVCQYVPGDINGSGTPNAIDVTYGVRFFKGGAPPPICCDCLPYGALYAAGDVNGNCVFNAIDITFFINYLKGIGPALMYCPECYAPVGDCLPPPPPPPPSQGDFHIWYGNPDGSVISVGLDSDIEIQCWGSTDPAMYDSVIFMHNPLASDNAIITARTGGNFTGSTKVGFWDDRSFLTPDLNSPIAGYTSQSMLGFAYFTDPRDPQYFFQTAGATELICTFTMHTTADPSYLNQTVCPFREGTNPANGSLSWGMQDGVSAVSPFQTFSCLYFSPPLSCEMNLEGSLNTPGTARAVMASGNYVYVAADDNGLQIVSIADPQNPVLIGNYDTPCLTYDVFATGNYCYLADCGEMYVINVSDPSNPTLSGTYGLLPQWSEGVFVSGNYAYVADGSSGVIILNVANPSNPTFAGSLDTPGFARGVTVAGNYAYVADGSSGLQIVNVSNPTSPFISGSYDSPGDAYDVFLLGNLAFISDAAAGIEIVDVTNPASPTLVGSEDTPGEARATLVTGNLAYVADGYLGIEAVDVTVPSDPMPCGNYDTPGFAQGIAPGGSFHVADGLGGIRIIQPAGRCGYTPGDINNYGAPNGIDVSYGVNFFKGGPAPPIDCGNPVGPCPQPSPFFAAGDVNGDCAFNGIDISYYVNYLKDIGPALTYCSDCPPAR